MNVEEQQPKDQFDEDTFYIPNAGDGISLVGHKTKCNKCKRKILVQLPLFGVPHHFDAMACCAECLEVDNEFKKGHPEVANDLMRWKDGASFGKHADLINP
jgi:hypothetical protein